MRSEVIIGFDSAWTGRNPGAICALEMTGGRPTRFVQPVLAGFDDASRLAREAATTASYLLMAIDQPTIVPNWTGLRPVERVAKKILDPMKGNVQPSNRGRTLFFGDDAPIWDFLDETGLRQNPTEARHSESGHFLIEVSPALALASIAEKTWRRGRIAKYNPARGNYSPEDWALVVEAVLSLCRTLGLPMVGRHVYGFLTEESPTKADQDCLDAVICMVIAYMWRYSRRDISLVIGDLISGYVVTPATSAIAARVRSEAEAMNVPVDLDWPCDSDHHVTFKKPAGD